LYLVFLLYALFSSVFIICKIALEYSQPLFLVGSRMLVAGLLITAYQLWRDPKGFSLNFKILTLAFFNIYLTNACEVWGLNYLSPAKTCLIYSLSPFVAAAFSFLLFSEKLSSKKWIGLLVGFLGFLPILLSKSSAEELTGSLWGFSWAELAVCVAAISNVYGWIILRQLVKEHEYSPMTANGLSMFIGGSLALFHSYLVEDWNPFPVTEYIPLIECSILLLVISNFICYNLYGFLLKRYTATFMSFAGLTTPLFAAFFAWMYFGEIVSTSFYVSLAIISVGLTLFYQEELRETGTVVENPQVAA
jgi:drug/metabolite transporter (DMT)-like permease